MILIDLIEDYLVDQEDGIKKLLTWFLNLVMQLEAMDQIEAEPYERADSYNLMISAIIPYLSHR